MGYTKSAVSGFSWNTALTIATTAVTAGKLMFVARLLEQREFGLFAYVTIALGLVDSVTQTGVNITIIQAKESIKYFVNTAWVIAIIRGLVIGLVMLALGVGMARFYSESSLTILVAIAAFVPVVKGFINPSIVSMQKELRFFRDSVYRFSLILVEAVLAVFFAFMFKSVTALIFSMIGAAIFEVVISFMFFKIRPVFEYIPNRAQQIFSHSKGLSVSAALSYISENVDELILGKTLGTNTLGVYHTGYSLSHKPTFGIAQSLTHSIIPVFSKIGNDLHRLKRAFIKSSITLFVLLLIGVVVLSIFSEPIVRIVLGEDWLAIVPVLPWLALAGALQAMTSTCYNLLIHFKSYRTMNVHRTAGIILFVPLLIWLSMQYGLLGAATAWVVARLVALPFAVYLVMRKLK